MHSHMQLAACTLMKRCTGLHSEAHLANASASKLSLLNSALNASFSYS